MSKTGYSIFENNSVAKNGRVAETQGVIWSKAAAQTTRNVNGFNKKFKTVIEETFEIWKPIFEDVAGHIENYKGAIYAGTIAIVIYAGVVYARKKKEGSPNE